MQGIEIMGRPISTTSVIRRPSIRRGRFRPAMTAIERGETGDEWLQRINLVACVATSKFQDGVLEEVRIYPVDLGVDRANRPWSKMSIR